MGMELGLYWGYAGVMEKKMETPKFGLCCHQPPDPWPQQFEVEFSTRKIDSPLSRQNRAIWGFYSNIPKTIFYLLKGDYNCRELDN